MECSMMVKPQFYTKISHAMDNGNFWLACSVAFTSLAPELDKPWSIIFYSLTAVCAIYGAALKSQTPAQQCNEDMREKDDIPNQ
jgi:hypothetical protein